MNRLFRILSIVLLVIFTFFISVFIAIQLPFVQTKITNKVINSLNNQFGTSLNVEKVDIDFWGDIVLYNVSAIDHHQLKFIEVPELIADISFWDIYRNSDNINLNSIKLVNADVKVITYKNEESSNFIEFVTKFNTKDDNSESNFKLKGNLKVVDSKLSIINQNLDKENRVWLNAQNVNLYLKDIDLENSTYQANIKSFEFDALKNGENFKLNNFAGKFELNDNEITLKDLIIDTQSSYLSGYFGLKYDSIAQFKDFSEKVNWAIHLEKNNALGFKDIRYFVHDWNSNSVIDIQGDVSGTLSKLKLKNLKAKSGKTKLNAESLNLNKIYESDFKITSHNISASTSYNDLISLLPSSINENISDYIEKFGTINYNGNLQIDKNNLIINGYAKSDLGNLNMKLSMKDYTENYAKYKGVATTEQFDLQKITGNKTLGKISGNITFSGNSYDIDNIEIQSNGKLNYIDINDTRYHNVTIDGILSKKVYNGNLAINDNNAKLSYDGIFDFSEDHFKLNFDTKIEYLNLTHFGLSDKKNTWLKASLKGNSNFSDINDFIGNIEFSDIIFNSDTINFKLPTAFFEVNNLNENTKISQKQLVLNVPQYINAEIIGAFYIDELVKELQNGFGKFLVDYEVRKVKPNQEFTFNIELENDLISYFIPELHLEPSTIINGFSSSENNIFEFALNSNQIKYDEYSAKNVSINASTTLKNSFHIVADELNIKNYSINQFKVEGKKIKDSITANAKFYTGENDFGKFDLNFYQVYNKKLKALKTGFNPSKIIVDDQVWAINPENDISTNYAILDFDSEKFIANQIQLQSEEQYLKFNGNYNDKNNFHIEADLENLNLSKIIPKALIPDFKIGGIANGHIDMKKSNNELKPVADIKIDSISLNNYYVGNFVTTAKYDIEESIFDIEGSLDRNNVNSLFITGSIDNKGTEPELDMVASLDDFNIGIIGVFLKDVLSEWSGKLSGDISLKGNPSDPDLQGFITGKDIGFKVVYLGTKYQMNGENELMLSKTPGTSGFLNLSEVNFTEVNSNTKASVDGNLIFTSITNWFLDLEFSTDRLLVMNTSVQDNELFYGKIFGKGRFEMFGPASDLEIFAHNVDVLKGSSISLNTGSTSSVEDKKFIRFYAYDKEGKVIQNENEQGKLSGITLDLLLNANEDTEINLVLDEKNDDKITARGEANDFLIQMNKAGKLYIEGEYTLNYGTYNYRQYVVIDKDFEIEKGGYIRFNGDPFNAEMNLKAVYSRYVNNLGEYVGISNNQTSLVDLIIAITGSLENTDVKFKIETPTASSQISSSLNNRLSSTPDELMKQASFLLALGRFGTDELVSAGTATGAATASAFELLGKQVGNIFSNIIPGLEINPTYLQSNDRTQESDRIQTQLNWAINDRLKINGAVGAPVGTEYNEVVTTQVEIDYDISYEGDKDLIIRGFSRPTTFGIENYNFNSTFAQSYGAGIIYKKSFNSFKDLFKPKNIKDSLTPIKKESVKQSISNNKSNPLSYIRFKR